MIGGYEEEEDEASDGLTQKNLSMSEVEYRLLLKLICVTS